MHCVICLLTMGNIGIVVMCLFFIGLETASAERIASCQVTSVSGTRIQSESSLAFDGVDISEINGDEDIPIFARLTSISSWGTREDLGLYFISNTVKSDASDECGFVLDNGQIIYRIYPDGRGARTDIVAEVEAELPSSIVDIIGFGEDYIPDELSCDVNQEVLHYLECLN